MLRQVDELADERDDVLRRQDADVVRRVDLEPLVQLVAPDLRQVVALGVEEEATEQVARVLERGRLTWALLLEHLDDRLLLAGGGVLLERVRDVDRVVEEGEDRLVRGRVDLEAGRRVLLRERAQERRDRQLSLAIDPRVDGSLLVDLELEPRATRRHQVGREHLLRRVLRLHEIGAGAPDELRHDHPLGAVDDEGALLGHHREVPHEDRLLPDLACLLVHEPDHHRQRRLVGEVLLAALLDREGRVAELVRAELHGQRARVVLDRRYVVDRLPKAFLHEPGEGRLLDVDQVRNLQNMVETGETCALRASGDLTGQLAATSLRAGSNVRQACVSA